MFTRLLLFTFHDLFFCLSFVWAKIITTYFNVSTDLFRQSPLMHRVRCQQTLPEKLRDQSKAVMSPKHDIVVVAHGTTTEKDSNPELTKLNTIPFCLPIIPSSVLSEYKSSSTVGHLDHATLLMMCLRYQDHLRQLSEAVAFDQNALCVPIKEVVALKVFFCVMKNNLVSCHMAFIIMQCCTILSTCLVSDFLAQLHPYHFVMKHFGHVVRMSFSRCRDRRFEPRQHQYFVSLSRTLYPCCFCRLSCEMSARWGQPREGCSVL